MGIKYEKPPNVTGEDVEEDAGGAAGARSSKSNAANSSGSDTVGVDVVVDIPSATPVSVPSGIVVAAVPVFSTGVKVISSPVSAAQQFFSYIGLDVKQKSDPTSKWAMLSTSTWHVMLKPLKSTA